MKYLKKYENESLKRVTFPPDIIDDIKDIFLELEDQYFNIEITKPNLKNLGRLNISIIKTSSSFVGAVPFKLGNIKEVIDRVMEYLTSLNVGYFLEEVDASGPDFKSFQKIELSKDFTEWDENQQIVLMNLYIDKSVTKIDKDLLFSGTNLNESLYESPFVTDLKDMALELTDMGYTVQIFKDQQEVGDNIRVIITHKSNFTINGDVKEFLFRAIHFMEENGFEYGTYSNYGRLYFTKDDRIIISSGEARPNYPSFTIINILFKKSGNS